MNILLSHPTGNSNLRAILSGLTAAGVLTEFNTTLAVHSEARWLKVLPKNIRAELLRRAFPVPANLVRTHLSLELARMLLPRLGLSNFVHHESGWASVDAVYQNLDKAVARRLAQLAKHESISAVYAYEDGAFNTFTQAKALGIKCIYDLPIAYWETGKALMAQEAVRLPNWAITLGGGLIDSSAKLMRKTRELEMADVVIVPSQFVEDSLPSWASNKSVILAPFGSPAGIVAMGERRHNSHKDRPLRVLFVGSMGQRKGLGDLFAAVRLLGQQPIELVVMGALLAPMEFYRSELPNFIYEIGRPHDQVLALMRSCDVFCLPSIVEGRALVMQEAMSQGLPLIITANTGGADLITEGHTGFLVPIQSPEAIAEKLTWFLNNRAKIPTMGKTAQEHAAKYTWQKYTTQVIDSLSNLLT